MDTQQVRSIVCYGAIGVCIIALIVGALVQAGFFEAGDPAPEQLYKRAMQGGDVAEQTASAVRLSKHDKTTSETLREVVTESKVPHVKAAAIAGLGRKRDVDSLPLLIDLMEHENTLVRGKAGVAVEEIVGLDFGFDPLANELERARVVSRYRQFWAECQQPESKFLQYMKANESGGPAPPPPPPRRP